MQVGDTIKVYDDELGIVEGVVVRFNHEGLPFASFGGNPPVIVYPHMVLPS